MRACRVLVADDSAAQRHLTAQWLKEMGHEVVEVGDGLEAMERLCAEKFDIVIADAEMPGAGALELLAFLRDRGTSIPVVVHSSNAELGAEALARGAADFVLKSSEAVALTHVLCRLLED